MKRVIFYLSLFLNVGAGVALGGEVLSVSQFLEQVRQKNGSYRAASDASEAGRLTEGEGKLLLSPVLFANAEYKDDGKPSPFPGMNYEKIVTQMYSLGVSQQTNFGLQAKAYYSIMDTGYKGMVPTYSEGRPAIELTQSLWRNDFGTEIRAQVEAETSKQKAKRYDQGFNVQRELVQAESAYWRLNLARQTLEIAKENLVRAEKIFAWAKRRVTLSLADRSDLLQTTAALQARKLDVKSAQDELRSASVAFNSARGALGESVEEKLEPLSADLIGKLKIPERVADRQDVMAAQAQSEAAKALSVMGKERNQPTLEVYGQYAFNSREDNKSDAFSESWDGKRPTKAIGLRFSSPLSFGTLSDDQAGYQKDYHSAQVVLERRRLLQEQDWSDLVARFREAKERLTASEELESAQKEKLEHERKRHERGQTTLSQVLTFETDLLNAQGLHLRTLAEVLQVAAQMKLYEVNL